MVIEVGLRPRCALEFVDGRARNKSSRVILKFVSLELIFSMKVSSSIVREENKEKHYFFFFLPLEQRWLTPFDAFVCSSSS